MKKFLSLIGLLAVLGMTGPAFAAPPPGGAQGGPRGGAPMHASARMHQLPHHGRNWGAPPPPPSRGHYTRSHAVVGGVLVRRSCWNDYFYDYRLGYCDNYYYRPHYRSGIYIRF